MSEYQYYEFQAIDRPLTEKEMLALRACSSRARISPTSFVNEYSWGSFKGNADVWMEKYFDAFLYLANCGTHILELRLPTRLLDLKTARRYCRRGPASVREKGGNVILTFESEDDNGEWEEGEGALSSVISVRAELARGDLRGLYLGWLLCVQSGDLQDDDLEPAVPPGLGELSASLEGLAEFLRIDGDLLPAAGQASPPIGETGPNLREIRRWVSKLPATERDDLLTRLVAGEDAALSKELRRRFDSQGRGIATTPPARRTVGELRRQAEQAAEERERLAAERAAEENSRRRREAAVARMKHLDKIAGKEPELWKQVGSLVATMQPQKYDLAVTLLRDLRDLAKRTNRDAFRRRLERLRVEHARKPSFLERLQRAGL